MLEYVKFSDPIARKLSCADSLDPLAQGADLQISSKRLQSDFFGTLLRFEHFRDCLPLLPDLVLLCRTHVPTIFVPVVILDAVDIFIVNFLILNGFFLAALNCETSHLKFCFFPLRERRSAISLPEHSFDTLELVVLFAS